jgi:hypothetical protein
MNEKKRKGAIKRDNKNETQYTKAKEKQNEVLY